MKHKNLIRKFFYSLLFSNLGTHAALDTNTVCQQPGINIDFLECAALINLYNITDGDNWTNNSGWGNADGATWYGLTVEILAGNVINLILPNNNLQGIIPATIRELSQLEVLDLSQNQLLDIITPDIGQMNKLRSLNLSQNMLIGGIPSSIGNLTQLQSIFLYGNQLSGPLPSQMGQLNQLQVLWIDGNNFSGSLPSSFGSMTSLVSL